jgi:hypothetical protein
VLYVLCGVFADVLFSFLQIFFFFFFFFFQKKEEVRNEIKLFKARSRELDRRRVACARSPRRRGLSLGKKNVIIRPSAKGRRV